jgi:hypothetical protein
VAILSLLLYIAVRGEGGWRRLLPRGEVAGVPEDDGPEEPVPDVSLAEARDAMDAVLADRDETWQRLGPIAEQLPELRPLAARHRRKAARK